MGVWSPKLYGNDVTADLKNVFRDLVRLPLSADELVDRLEITFGGPADPRDECYTSFCLALADLLHTYGLDAPPAFHEALRIISTGEDLRVHRQLGMSDQDLRQRALVLQELGDRIVRPNPKPRKRNVLVKPEPWLFEEGAVVAYPTRANEPINPYFPKRLMTDWVADGWGRFVVLARDRIHGYFAVYLIAILPPLEGSDADFPYFAVKETVTCVPELVTVTSAHSRKMQLKSVGDLDLKHDAIEAHFVPGTPPFDFQPRLLANALFRHIPFELSACQLDLGRFATIPAAPSR